MIRPSPKTLAILLQGPLTLNRTAMKRPCSGSDRFPSRSKRRSVEVVRNTKVIEKDPVPADWMDGNELFAVRSTSRRRSAENRGLSDCDPNVRYRAGRTHR